MQPYKKLLIASLFVFAAGCRSTTENSGTVSDLQTNRQRWASRNIARYEFTYDRVCFCVPVGARRVSVRDGKVVGVTLISTGESLDTRDAPTVDSLFALVERGIKNHFSTLRVNYDPELGYPTQVFADESFDIADDEYTYTAANLVTVK